MRRTIVATVAGLLAWAGLPAGASHQVARPDLTITRLLAPEARAGEVAATPAALGNRYPWRIPRSGRDRPDLGGGPQVHVVYLSATDQPSPPLDRRGVLEDSVRAFDRWMKQQSGASWRLDLFRFRAPGRRRPVRAVDVTFVRSERPNDEVDTLDEIALVLADHDLDREGKRYLVYAAVDAGGICGEAEYPLSDDPQQTGQYAVVYLNSDEACGTGDFARNRRTPSRAEAVAIHEVIHNDGAVPLVAPHSCHGFSIGHACTPGLVLTDLDPEVEDLLFPFAGGPLTEKVLDRGQDDYFRHPFPYRDLADSPFLRG